MGTRIDDQRLDEFSLLRRGERDAAFVAVETSRRQLTAVILAMINTVERSGSFTDDGHRNVVCWVVGILHVTQRSERAREGGQTRAGPPRDR